jgi:hypothetical protein
MAAISYPSVIFLLTLVILVEIIFQNIINLFVIGGMHFDLKILCLVFYIISIFYYYKKRILIIDAYIDIVKENKLLILIPLLLLLSQTFSLSYLFFCIYFNILELDFNLYLNSNLLSWLITESHSMEQFGYDSELGGSPSENSYYGGSPSENSYYGGSPSESSYDGGSPSEGSYDNTSLPGTIILPFHPTLELQKSIEESLPMINDVGVQTVTTEVTPRLPYLIYFLGLGTSLLIGYAGYRYLGSVNPDVIEVLPKIIDVVPEIADAGFSKKVVDALNFQAVIYSLYHAPITLWIKFNKPGPFKICINTVINTVTSSQRVLLNKEIIAQVLSKNYFRLSILTQGLGGVIHWYVF